MTVFLNALIFVLEKESQYWQSRDCLTDGLLINCPQNCPALWICWLSLLSLELLWEETFSPWQFPFFFRPFGLTVFSLWFLFAWSIIILSSRNLYFWFVYGILSSWWLQLVLNCFLRAFFFCHVGICKNICAQSAILNWSCHVL